jgi:hypothetical protein
MMLPHVHATHAIMHGLMQQFALIWRRYSMRKFIIALSALSLAIPVSMAIPTDKAEARRDRDRDYRGGRHYRGRNEWRGRDGRTYCRKSNGTTGLIVGGVGGALAGRAIDTNGDRATGTILGAAGGALLGKAIDSKRTCR